MTGKGGWRHISSERDRRTRPNFFLALPLAHSSTVLAAVNAVQTSLVEHSPSLTHALVDPASMHLTVLVMSLEDEEATQRARRCLQELSPVLAAQQLLQPLRLSFQGLSHFNNKVLYLDITQGLEALSALARLVQQHFQAAGLMHQEERDFTPHATVAKMSKMLKGGNPRSRGHHSLRSIPPEAYAQHSVVDAGEVHVDELVLCQMGGRAWGSFYVTHERLCLLPQPSLSWPLRMVPADWEAVDVDMADD